MAAALATVVAAVAAPACSDVPNRSPSPVCRQGSDSVIVFQGPSGRCIPRTRIVGYRCAAAAPEIVTNAGSAKERRYLGGGFATTVQRLPEGAQSVGVGDGNQIVTNPDRDVLYTVRGSESQKWLTLPDAETVRADGPQATMIGDSILLASQPSMSAQLPGWSIAFDAVNGRSSLSGVAIADTIGTASDDVVVVELGTNDASVTAFRDHARQILTALKDVPLVLWQTVKGPPEVVVNMDEINTVIRQAVASRSNLALADWAGLVREEDLSFDGVHPSLGNEDAMANIVAPMLLRWWSAVTVQEPGCSE